MKRSFMNFKKGNSNKNSKQPSALSRADSDMLDFPVKEAINLLRTNLTLSFVDNQGARVIGVTSSTKGEGKSFVARNIAKSLAEMGYKVLLLEGDLRLPTVAKRMRIRKSPGLSNILTGSINEIVDALQQNVYDKLDVLTAGDIPPNPSELLGSKRMKTLMALLSENYDYIVFDLPPVTAVPDPLIVTQIVDGMVITVRHEYCDRNALDETMRQLMMTETKILGFVYNGNNINSGSRGKYYKKGRYYTTAYEKRPTGSSSARK